MSEAEKKFLQVVWQALYDVHAEVLGKELEEPLTMNDIDRLAAAVVGSLKLDEWLIRSGDVYEVEESSWLDYVDESSCYEVWVKANEEDE